VLAIYFVVRPVPAARIAGTDASRCQSLPDRITPRPRRPRPSPTRYLARAQVKALGYAGQQLRRRPSASPHTVRSAASPCRPWSPNSDLRGQAGGEPEESDRVKQRGRHRAARPGPGWRGRGSGGHRPAHVAAPDIGQGAAGHAGHGDRDRMAGSSCTRRLREPITSTVAGGRTARPREPKLHHRLSGGAARSRRSGACPRAAAWDQVLRRRSRRSRRMPPCLPRRRGG